MSSARLVRKLELYERSQEGVVPPAVVAPTVAKATTTLEHLLTLEHPIAVLMPLDLVPGVSVPPAATARWADKKLFVFAADTAGWLLLNWPAPVVANAHVVLANAHEPVLQLVKPDSVAVVLSTVRHCSTSMLEPEVDKMLEDGFALTGGLWLKGDLIHITDESKFALIYAVHLEFGHMGTTQLFNFIRSKYLFDGMYAAVTAVIRQCLPCLLSKAAQTVKGLSLSPLEVLDRNQVTGVDVHGPTPPDEFGNCFVCTIVDLFHGFTRFVPMKVQTAAATAAALIPWFWDRGIPLQVLSDRHSTFLSSTLKLVLEAFGSVGITTAPYSSYQLGRVEIRHRLLNQFFRSLNPQQFSRWGSFMPQVSSIYNRTPSTRHSWSPWIVEYPASPPWDAFTVMRPAAVPANLIDQLETESAITNARLLEHKQIVAIVSRCQVGINTERKQLLAAQSKQKPREFKIGQRVAVFSKKIVQDVKSKLLFHWNASFTVTHRRANNIYVVQHDITKEFRDASPGNMVACHASVVNVENWYEYWKPNGLNHSAILPEEDQSISFSQTYDDFKPGMFAVIHDTFSTTAATPTYFIARITAVSEIESRFVAQVYDSQRRIEPKFNPMWSDPSGSKHEISRYCPTKAGLVWLPLCRTFLFTEVITVFSDLRPELDLPDDVHALLQNKFEPWVYKRKQVVNVLTDRLRLVYLQVVAHKDSANGREFEVELEDYGSSYNEFFTAADGHLDPASILEYYAAHPDVDPL
jgi:hypothetical protein